MNDENSMTSLRALDETELRLVGGGFDADDARKIGNVMVAGAVGLVLFGPLGGAAAAGLVKGYQDAADADEGAREEEPSLSDVL